MGCTNGCVRGVVGRRAARAIIPSPTSEAAWESARARASCKRRTTTPAFRSLQPTAAPSGSPCEPRSHAQASAVPVRCSAAPSVPMVETEQDRFWQGDKPTACRRHVEAQSTPVRLRERVAPSVPMVETEQNRFWQGDKPTACRRHVEAQSTPVRLRERVAPSVPMVETEQDRFWQGDKPTACQKRTEPRSQSATAIRPHGRDRAGSVLARRRADGVSETHRTPFAKRHRHPSPWSRPSRIGSGKETSRRRVADTSRRSRRRQNPILLGRVVESVAAAKNHRKPDNQLHRFKVDPRQGDEEGEAAVPLHALGGAGVHLVFDHAEVGDQGE